MPATILHNIKERIDILKLEIGKIEDEKSRLLKLSPDQLLAIELHGLLCKLPKSYNSVPSCSWNDFGTSMDPSYWFTEPEHVKYLSMAKKLLAISDIDTCYLILEIIFKE